MMRGARRVLSATLAACAGLMLALTAAAAVAAAWAVRRAD